MTFGGRWVGGHTTYFLLLVFLCLEAFFIFGWFAVTVTLAKWGISAHFSDTPLSRQAKNSGLDNGERFM